ncbi:protein kinase C-binding protein 1 isoform X2 [Belonocnema kinseyi]|uniref:protein kinase C-binding protein 1 isoform X2 n=1 Tax=Belonocnema kinseyi TaxID=2817044 RepID=UPI00143DE380|nr:protein kinase C-binding protein 1 isoform X2 [Belonocnema kinseyi]
MTMDSSNSSKENVSNSSLSVEVITNESGSKNNDTEVKIDKENSTSDELSNDLKAPEIIDSKTEQKNCVSAENKDKYHVEMVPVKSDVKNDINADEPEKEVKRKRKKSLSVQDRESPEESGSKSKRTKLQSIHDKFCWRCHKESVEIQCSACPRSWHRKCIGGAQPASVQNWICGECATILKSENAETRSEAMAQLSVDQLCMLLKHIIERMRDYPGSEPFWKEVDTKEIDNYMEYVVKPMDLGLLESNVKAKLYGSTDAFMADAKWIQHNCIVFNTYPSKITNAAKQIVKVARQEVSELEACPDCYMHGRNLPRPLPSWFIEPCHRPHLIVWAKLKGFPFWPAKAMPRVNGAGHVDVRFFGEHDRAWVLPKDVFLYSEEPPFPLPRKKKNEMDECVREVARHCRKLEQVFGEFKFAPSKLQYNPHDSTQIQIMLPNYEPSPHSSMTQFLALKKRPSFRNRWESTEPTSQDVSNASTDKSNMSPIKSRPTTPGITKKKLQRKSISISSTSIIDKEQSIVPIKKPDTSDSIKKNESKPKLKSHKKEDMEVPALQELSILVDKSSGSLRSNSTINKFGEEVSQKSITKDTKITTPKIVPNVISTFLATSTPKIALKPIKPNTNKLYKPKKTMIDKMNAVKDPKLNSSKEPTTVLEVKSPNNSASSSVVTSPPIRFYVLAGDKAVEVKKLPTDTVASQQSGLKTVPPVKQEPREVPVSQKKQSKAKKSFPNRPPNFSFPPKTPTGSPDAMVYIPPQRTESSVSQQQLPPPEAGPFSSKLHERSLELAKRMAQIMEEALRETVLENADVGQTSKDACQATIHFLKLEIERMRWQHQQQLDELKYNTDRTLKEMRASLEAERLRAIAETRKQAEDERLRCVEEIKKKQWCAMCGREALFYCCWNTAYCDYPCQQKHWPSHLSSCAQNPSSGSIVVSTTPVNVNINDQQQNGPNAKTCGRVHTLPPSEFRVAPTSNTCIPHAMPMASLKLQQR